MHWQAHKLGKRYPKHLFLTYGSYEFQWWTVEDQNFVAEEELDCTAEDRAKVLEFSFAALHFPSSITVTVSVHQGINITCTLWHTLIEQSEHRVHPPVESTSYTEIDSYHQCYDAVLALAMSLNKTIGGTYIYMSLHSKLYLKIALLLELNTNQSLKEAAKEQAGLKQDKDFQITDFNYNVDTVAKVLTKHLSNINFTGASVCMTAIM